MSQREALIRLAASLPAGDNSRKLILSGLTRQAVDVVEDAFESELVQQYILKNPEISQWKRNLSDSYRFFKANKHYYIDAFTLGRNGEKLLNYRYCLTAKTITPFGMTVDLSRDSVTPSGFIDGGTHVRFPENTFFFFHKTPSDTVKSAIQHLDGKLGSVGRLYEDSGGTRKDWGDAEAYFLLAGHVSTPEKWIKMLDFYHKHWNG